MPTRTTWDPSRTLTVQLRWAGSNYTRTHTILRTHVIVPTLGYNYEKWEISRIRMRGCGQGFIQSVCIIYNVYLIDFDILLIIVPAHSFIHKATYSLHLQVRYGLSPQLIKLFSEGVTSNRLEDWINRRQRTGTGERGERLCRWGAWQAANLSPTSHKCTLRWTHGAEEWQGHGGVKTGLGSTSQRFSPLDFFIANLLKTTLWRSFRGAVVIGSGRGSGCERAGETGIYGKWRGRGEVLVLKLRLLLSDSSAQVELELVIDGPDAKGPVSGPRHQPTAIDPLELKHSIRVARQDVSGSGRAGPVP